MKITRSTTVAQLKEFLNINFKGVQKADKALADSMSYAAKQMKEDPKKVKKADLVDLAKQVIAVLGDKVKEITPIPTTPVVAENSVKPKLSASKDKADKSSKKEEQPAKEEQPKKEDNKTAEKGDEKPKADKPKAKPPVPESVTAEVFPDELKIGDTKYTIAHDVTSITDLLKAFNDNEEIVFAYYWTKAQLKQFNYANGTLKTPKNGFSNNLDLATTLYVSDNEAVCYNLSMYTEALYQVMPESFEEYDGVRYSDGIEFQIYRAESK